MFENKMVIIKVEQKYQRVMRFIGRGFLRTRNTRIGDRNGTNDPEHLLFRQITGTPSSRVRIVVALYI